MHARTAFHPQSLLGELPRVSRPSSQEQEPVFDELARLSVPERSRNEVVVREGASWRIEDAIARMLVGDTKAADDIAYFAKNRDARVELFRVVASMKEKQAAADVLLTALVADGPPSHWIFRKKCFETLLEMSSAPLIRAFNVLLCTKDPLIRNLAIKKITETVSFPLSSQERQEVRALGQTGGQLLHLLLRDAPVVGEKPLWVSNYPRLVRSWIWGCSAAGVASGIERQELQKFDRTANGPLNTWHIERAVAPLTPTSGAWIISLLRKALRS